MLDNEQLVNGLFRQMFSRDSDPAGLAFYVGRLESGEATLVSIAKQVADGALNDDLVSLHNKIIVANEFTNHIELNGLAYVAADIPVVQAMLAVVTAAPESVASALQLVAAFPNSAARYPSSPNRQSMHPAPSNPITSVSPTWTGPLQTVMRPGSEST